MPEKPEFSKAEDANSYNDYALDYGRYISRLAEPLASRICDLASLKLADRVLDVGCGTGVSTRQAAARVGGKGHVTAIDLSAGMVEVTRSMDTGACPTELLVMDAEHLDFPDRSFDALISLCAILHFPDLEAFVKEAGRVVKPGGRVVVSFGQSRPDQLPLKLKHYAKRILQSLSKPHQFAPAFLLDIASKYVPEDHNHNNDVLTPWSRHNPKQKIEAALSGAGFKDVSAQWYGHDVYFSTAQDYWDAQMSIVTEFRKRADRVSPQSLLNLKAEFLERAQDTLDKNGSLVYPYGALFISATRV